MARPGIYIGTAGWALAQQRYAATLPAIEINSSFYRAHLPKTYARWAATVPEPFRFSVKIPRRITHVLRLAACAEELTAFLAGVRLLGAKLGPLLVQLPPSLPFDPEVASAFFGDLRARHAGPLVCEPRHATWFQPAAEALLATFHVARVAADPCPWTAGPTPAGWASPVYLRLHGSPIMYVSAYESAALEALALEIESHHAFGREVWCIFDNTARGAALPNAQYLMARLGGSMPRFLQQPGTPSKIHGEEARP